MKEKQTNQHVLFPVEMKGHWRTDAEFEISDYLRDWLLDPGSLTARLKRHCHDFHVAVLGQEITRCSADESTGDIESGQEVLVREVLLYCDDQPQVFARSLLPLSSLTGSEQQLANLGNQSLGQVLFNHPNLKRKRIELACFNPQSTVTNLSRYLGLNTQDNLWGRRSTFVLDGKPLLVAEVFLPNAIAYQQENVC